MHAVPTYIVDGEVVFVLSITRSNGHFCNFQRAPVKDHIIALFCFTVWRYHDITRESSYAALFNNYSRRSGIQNLSRTAIPCRSSWISTVWRSTIGVSEWIQYNASVW